MTQWVKAILLIKYYLIDTKILFVIFSYAFNSNGFTQLLPFKRKEIKAKDKDKDFDFMNVLLASKTLKIIWKYDKSLKNMMSFS